MKLYATTTSERATKGQGGNKRIDIQLTVGTANEQHEAGVITMREKEKGVFIVGYIANRRQQIINTIDTTKGKKKKGE